MSAPQYTLPSEQWLPIVGWEALYEVSDLGRVRRIAPTPSRYFGCIQKPRDNGNGYMQVQLCCGGTRIRLYLHVLVARAFIGPCPPGMEVNHKDLKRANCRLDNLEYLTRSQNILHGIAARAQQGHRRGTPRPRKLTVEQARAIRASAERPHALARQFGVDPATVRHIRQRLTWAHLADEGENL